VTAAAGTTPFAVAPLLERLGPRGVLAAAALACLAGLAAALVTQHVFDMQPCPWCVLQRLVFVLIVLACGVGAALPGAAARCVAALTAAALSLAGAAAALWHQFVAASAASCDLTLADRIMSATGLDMALPQVFAPFASCADAQVRLLGISYPLWSLALYVLAGSAAGWVWRRMHRAAA
jgi:disulfide bond formation protein DsbB